MLQTAQDYILMACRKLGAMRPGAKPMPELMQEILTDWQVWFDSLNTSGVFQYSNPDYVYPVIGPGSQNGGNGYTIGPSGADWIGPRPTRIIHANLVFSSGGQPKVYLSLIPISQEEWATLAVRQIASTNVTSDYWYDPQFPNGVFNVFPPLNGNAIELFEIGALVPPMTLTATFMLPPGYADGIVWGLAKRNYYSMISMLNRVKIPYPICVANALKAWEPVVLLNKTHNTIGTDYPIGGGPLGAAPLYDSFVTATGEPL